MITSLLDPLIGNNPDILLAREKIDEPSRSPCGDVYNFLIAPKELKWESWLEESIPTFNDIKHHSFIRVLITLPGASFYAWKYHDGKIYI